MPLRYAATADTVSHSARGSTDDDRRHDDTVCMSLRGQRQLSPLVISCRRRTFLVDKRQALYVCA